MRLTRSQETYLRLSIQTEIRDLRNAREKVSIYGKDYVRLVESRIRLLWVTRQAMRHFADFK